MTTKLTTIRSFLDRAKKEDILVNTDLEKAIVSQTDTTRIIGDGLADILIKTLREANARNSGIYTTATIIIAALK